MAGIFWSATSWQEHLSAAESNLMNTVSWEGVSWRALDVPISMGGKTQTIHTIMVVLDEFKESAADLSEQMLRDGKSAGAAEDGECTEEADDDASSYPLVLWPGFGQGAASYWQSLPELARQHGKSTGGKPVFALDWLGAGLSSRPPWTFGVNDPAAAQAWFSESLEAWRSAVGMKRMHLVAHR